MKPTTDRLRHDIDHGRGGDKVDFPDPSAAPLGVDDEAGGTSPSADDVAVAYAGEIGETPTPPTSGERARSISGENKRSLRLGVAVGLAAAVVVLVAVIALAV